MEKYKYQLYGPALGAYSGILSAKGESIEAHPSGQKIIWAVDHDGKSFVKAVIPAEVTVIAELPTRNEE